MTEEMALVVAEQLRKAADLVRPNNGPPSRDSLHAAGVTTR